MPIAYPPDSVPKLLCIKTVLLRVFGRLGKQTVTGTLPVVYCLLSIPFCIPWYCLLSVAYCLPVIAYYILPIGITYCLLVLLTACCF